MLREMRAQNFFRRFLSPKPGKRRRTLVQLTYPWAHLQTFLPSNSQLPEICTMHLRDEIQKDRIEAKQFILIWRKLQIKCSILFDYHLDKNANCVTRLLEMDSHVEGGTNYVPSQVSLSSLQLRHLIPTQISNSRKSGPRPKLCRPCESQSRPQSISMCVDLWRVKKVFGLDPVRQISNDGDSMLWEEDPRSLFAELDRKRATGLTIVRRE